MGSYDPHICWNMGGQPQWLEEILDAVQILDVWEADEFVGPLGRIPGARLISLGKLEERADLLTSDKPIVTICRAGRRSAQATNILSCAGFNKTANLAGEILRWRTQGYPVLGDSS